ncbi:hypothetical protein EST38_g3258 [Candolleomyces aberdarensis]|uniref:RNase III domain-containing protein n=1 Tax=Candolleomyces aberdarensis TaxID=2316362 RepID=A0A4Q2DQ96_9AGAR|nr:hypothetical protein EST38_g3258 [Candolleomyces aberdarensis]
MNFVFQPGLPYAEPPPYTHLKRARSRDGDGFTFNPARAPPLPPITNIDILLQVFTHPSIRRQSSHMPMDVDDYADNERLTFIGKFTLDAAVDTALFNHRPMLKGHQMTEKRLELLSDEAFDTWVSHYKLLTKLRCDLDLRSSYSINKPKETRAIFHAYVGGLYQDSGAGVAYQWIAQLLEQYLTSFDSASTEESEGRACVSSRTHVSSASASASTYLLWFATFAFTCEASPTSHAAANANVCAHAATVEHATD